jgi:hypothetical protein
MRKVKTIKIDDKEITLKELRVKDIKVMLDGAKAGDLANIESYLPVVSGLTMAEIEELAPSELKLVVDAAKEVNADFLAGLDMLGIMSTIKAMIQKQLTGLQVA